MNLFYKCHSKKQHGELLRKGITHKTFYRNVRTQAPVWVYNKSEKLEKILQGL